MHIVSFFQQKITLRFVVIKAILLIVMDTKGYANYKSTTFWSNYFFAKLYKALKKC